jgi:hypothetical protein
MKNYIKTCEKRILKYENEISRLPSYFPIELTEKLKLKKRRGVFAFLRVLVTIFGNFSCLKLVKVLEIEKSNYLF